MYMLQPWDQMVKQSMILVLDNGNSNFSFQPSIEPNDPGLNYSTPTYLTLDQINGDDRQLWLSKQAISRGVHTIYADAWSADC